MSLEAKIEALTKAVVELTKKMSEDHVVSTAPSNTITIPTAPVAPVVPTAPVAPVVPTAPVAPVVPVMSVPPTFTTPVVAPAPVSAPFSDITGLTQYAMSVYQALGAQKGALIQNVLTSLGHQNITDIRPDQYLAFYQGVEALKG